MDTSSARAQARDQQARVHGSVEVDRYGRSNREESRKPKRKLREKRSAQQIDYDFYLSD